MKIIITGSTGNISKPLASSLVAAGHDVTVISSSSDKIREIEVLGARAAIGSVEDVSFLKKTFKGADGVYTMIPPKLDADNWGAFIHKVADSYVHALQGSGVARVVHLSSMGAHVAENGGLLSIYYGVEEKLRVLDGVTFLRPGSFYNNFYGNIGMIKQFGVIGNNYGELLLPMADPRDIALAAFEELLATRSGVRYVVSDERLTSEIAAVLGKAIGKPELQWVKFKDEDVFKAMVQNGITSDVATNLLEMGHAAERGETSADYLKNRPAFGAIKLEDFAVEFAAAYGRG